MAMVAMIAACGDGIDVASVGAEQVCMWAPDGVDVPDTCE